MFDNLLLIKICVQLPTFCLLAFLAFKKKWLTTSGCFTAILIGFCFFTYLDLIFPLILFIGGTLLSKLNKDKKEKNGRNAYQVLANGGIGVICLLYFYSLPLAQFSHLGYVAFMVSFSISIADTFSSEIGCYIKGKTFDILTFQPIKTGMSGGISLEGTLGGIGGGLIAGIAAYFIVDNLEISFLVAFVGIIGMLVDSVLGSWLQAKYINSVGEVSEEKELDNKLIRGYAWCTNNMVNLLSNLLVIAGFIVYKKF